MKFLRHCKDWFKEYVLFIVGWFSFISGSVSVPFAYYGLFVGEGNGKTISLVVAGICLCLTVAGLIKRNVELKRQIKPKLQVACDMDTRGCRVETTMLEPVHPSGISGFLNRGPAYFFRIKVEQYGMEPIRNCTAYITRIMKNDVIVMEDELFRLTFCPGNEPDALAKTITNRVPAFLDVLTIPTNTNGPVTICQKGFVGPRNNVNNNLFGELGNYVLTIVISGDGTADLERDYMFNWTGNARTSGLTLLPEDSDIVYER